MSVLSNATVLSNFASIGSIAMLCELYGEIFIAVDVYREIQDGLEEGYGFYREVDKLVF